jgi:hypothetical protein
MPKKRSGDIHDIVQSFVARLSSLIEADAVSRARDAVLTAFGASGELGGGASRASGATGAALGRPRGQGPRERCPVPGCSNRAAPVFGMVCAKHKDLPKATIKKYREQRRNRKAAGKKR